MRRALPHDLTNALAAAALVMELGLAGAGRGGNRARVVPGAAAPHRARRRRPTGSSGTTTPRPPPPTPRPSRSSAFDHVVLIAGGRNKGLDLTADGGRARTHPRRGGDRRDGRRQIATTFAPALAAAAAPDSSGSVDVRGRRRRRDSCQSRRRRPAFTRLRQLRLVSDGRLRSTWGRLPRARAAVRAVAIRNKGGYMTVIAFPGHAGRVLAARSLAPVARIGGSTRRLARMRRWR